jgi:hypothetical protein
MIPSTTDTPARWIKDHGHPLTIDDPDSVLADLSPLRNMARDARLVVLGVSLREQQVAHHLALGTTSRPSQCRQLPQGILRIRPPFRWVDLPPRLHVL